MDPDQPAETASLGRSSSIACQEFMPLRMGQLTSDMPIKHQLKYHSLQMDKWLHTLYVEQLAMVFQQRVTSKPSTTKQKGFTIVDISKTSKWVQQPLAYGLNLTAYLKWKKNEVYKIYICQIHHMTCYQLNVDAKQEKVQKQAACKQIDGALCYALVEFCKSGQLPEFLSCTKSRSGVGGKTFLPKMNKVLPHSLNIIQYHILYEPPLGSARLTENLRVDMLKFNPKCGLLQLLDPSVDVALHDHDYIPIQNLPIVLRL